jgi:hypothetical protein
MKEVKKYWMVVLLGAVLVAAFVGPAGARPDQSPEAGALTRRITVPAGHFFPQTDGTNWTNNGANLHSDVSGSPVCFTAPVVFPTGQSVVVESITLYALDDNGADDMYLRLYKTDPTGGDELEMAHVSTSGSSSTDPRHFTDGTIENNPVKHGRGVYLWLCLEDNYELYFYGVRIEYHHGTT